MTWLTILGSVLWSQNVCAGQSPGPWLTTVLAVCYGHCCIDHSFGNVLWSWLHWPQFWQCVMVTVALTTVLAMCYGHCCIDHRFGNVLWSLLHQNMCAEQSLGTWLPATTTPCHFSAMVWWQPWSRGVATTTWTRPFGCLVRGPSLAPG